ncbi:angiotensin-converting enzyme [Agrilus planipennis]|uniref:Angiotensin-converting enzyme n=1 Tax=Agrilus planipennis TaxID=224129 RepID=A0A7F5RDL8_AGRPL|nr:angiotensin-converting enzyme [Agrilus planipennis]XP_025834026.1 angiotensin-converting enzyme [Agrilus planipennis]XP_025834027.1 angiotensin-converting enzyme [Agrilus planipennis]XP_025834028.1 angiotensin-converting enzyme [Agrilus planipennis]XP_025834029.1 angiotensin-converting enzyme [Agrilus planipennis]
MSFLRLLGVCLLVSFTTSSDPEIEEEELRARTFMQIIDSRDATLSNKVTLASWAYASNLTEENLQYQLKVSAEAAKQIKEDWQEIIKYNWRVFDDGDLKRKFEKYSILGVSALPEEKYSKREKIISDMEAVYAKAKICDYKDQERCDLALEPEITRVFETSRDPEELKHAWVEWRKKTRIVRDLYKEYVDLSNEAARLNNFTDYTEMWLDDFESSDFRQQVQKLWEQLKPLYLQIHAYVRFQLRKKYGDIVSEKGPIPAHLLGNMWAQVWEHVEGFSQPFPGKVKLEATPEMVKQNYTPFKMFKLAEEFFVSLNLSAMPPLFWERSILEKPNDGRELVCHASAWDFYDGKDFRIKQCTQVNEGDLYTAHHEMGHIQYYLQYKHQPVIFRKGANSGFHEAVGDVMSLSVSTTKHLKKIGLLDSDFTEDPEVSINNLYKVGLDKIAFLPFGYLMDLWRWDVFSGKITPDEYNCKWWELREKYQGVEPPTNRSEEDFDPAAKYHIVANVPYIRYFVSFIIQFQFHRALCEKADQYDPNDPTKKLHECDIYQSAAAGNALANMLQMGSSKPWPEAMKELTGQPNMDAGALLEYFDPLLKWLKAENKKNGAFIGWESSNKKCSSKKSQQEELKDDEEKI